MFTKNEMQNKLYNVLKEFGLTESEANLYITSLALGPVTIVKLAENLNMPRPNVYKVIAGLERHGLAKFSERKRYARTFVVESPTVVLEKLRQKSEAVASLDRDIVRAMPDLLALYRQGEMPTKIKILEGKEQYFKIFFQTIDEAKDEMRFFGSATDFIGFVSWEEEIEWIKKRIKKGISIKALLLPSKDADLLKEKDSKEMRETRIIEGVTPFVTSFQIFANKVLIWQPKTPLAILIEDEYITQMLISIFDTLWTASKK